MALSRPLLAALVAAVAVLVPLGAWANGMRHYDELRLGGHGAWHGDGMELADNYMVDDELRLPFKPGGIFDVGFEVHNLGDRSVRITGLDVEDGIYLFDDISVWMARDNDMGAARPEQEVPFAPFTLGAKESRWVSYRYRLTDCSTTPGGSSGLRFRTVRYKVGPFRRSVDLAMPHPVAILGVPGSCPRPPSG